MNQQNATQLFAAIGEKTRLEIINLCLTKTMTVEELLAFTKLNKSLLSKHLKVLKQNGILLSVKDGRAVSYRLNPSVYNGDKKLTLPCCDIFLK